VIATVSHAVSDRHALHRHRDRCRRSGQCSPGTKIITSDNAVGLCSSNETGPGAKEHQRREIEARVRAYLDWRARL
jgi:hypothetical protein